MSQERACTFCGAGGHFAAQCTWNEEALLAERETFERELRIPDGLVFFSLGRYHPCGFSRSARDASEAASDSWRSWIARAALAQPSPAQEEWRAMAGAPKDGSLVRLLVRFDEHSIDDGEGPFATIGQNNMANDGEDRWQVVGWCWEHDHFTDGKGTPLGWLPLLADDEKPDDQAFDRNAERLTVEAFGTGSGINPQATSIDDLFLDGTPAPELGAKASRSLPPFAEKVLSKLRRFYDCAEDFESGGVDIGRHWLDLLTQLGLLNRVQRSPALWEISQQGEDLLEAPVAQAGQVRAIQVCKLGIHGKAYDLPENKRAYTYAEQPDNLVASRLGHAYVETSLPYAGDSIDRGLILLRELQAIGFGVFELSAAPAQGGE